MRASGAPATPGALAGVLRAGVLLASVWLTGLSLGAPAALAQHSSADSARAIQLDEAVRLARRNAPAAVQARGQERVSRAAVTSAYAAFLPNVSVSLGGVRQFSGDGQRTRFNPQTGATEIIPAQPWTYSDGLSLSVDLFDGGRRFFEIGTARANVRASEAAETAQGFTTSLEVQQQFYAVLAARESEVAARAQLDEAQQELSAATARVAAGAATRSDSLRSVILVGNARLALLTAQTNLRNANVALTRLVASSVLVTAAPSDTLDLAPVPLDSAQLAQLADHGPAVQQAEAQLSAARAGVRSARTPYLPTVSAGYSRGGSGFDPRFGYGTDPFAYQGSLRLSLSYPLFNQYAREEGVVRARVSEETAEAQLRDTRLAAQQQVVQALGALLTALQQVEIQQASVRAAEEDLRVQRQRYQLGASTLLDQLTSQTQLTQARAQLIQARFNARVARAQLEAAVGRDL
jgi:outer membrane protein